MAAPILAVIARVGRRRYRARQRSATRPRWGRDGGNGSVVPMSQTPCSSNCAVSVDLRLAMHITLTSLDEGLLSNDQLANIVGALETLIHDHVCGTNRARD